MRAIKLIGHISTDHILRLNLPADIAEGPAEVIVLVPEKPIVDTRRSLATFLNNLSESSNCVRSKKEIDFYLEEERNNWDR